MIKSVEGILVRDLETMQVHLSGCENISWDHLSPTPFTWAEGKTRQEIEAYVKDSANCRLCEPLDTVFNDGEGVFYNQDSNVISRMAAVDMIRHGASDRVVRLTNMEFLGHKLMVVSTFVPVDHSETHGRYTRSPACWITEIVGGPPEMDGTSRYSRSKQSCHEFHDEIVELAMAAGCIVTDLD